MIQKDRWDYLAENLLTALLKIEQTDPQKAFNVLAMHLREIYKQGKLVGPGAKGNVFDD